MWWQTCGHVNVGICFECTAGEPRVGSDVRWMWLIVLLLLRTLFRLPPGPFSIHPLSVCTAAHKFYSLCLEPTGSLNNCFIDEFHSYKAEHHTRLGTFHHRKMNIAEFFFLLFYYLFKSIVRGWLCRWGQSLKISYWYLLFTALSPVSKKKKVRGEMIVYVVWARSKLFHYLPCRKK